MFRHMAGDAKRPRVAVSSAQRAVRVPREGIRELVAFAARAESARVGDVDVAVVGAEEMAALSGRYLGRRGATDVLSFDLSDRAAGAVSGQIVVCGEVAAAEAAARALRPQHELMRYVLHGLLHLLGYDDRHARDAARMHARQEELLWQFLQRPQRSRRAPRAGGRAKRPTPHE
jgi:probable rRNA maturation factor